MRTTKKLSRDLVAIQEEAMERIKSFFKGKKYVRIHILPSQHLNIHMGLYGATVTEIHSNGDIYLTANLGRWNKVPTKLVCRVIDNEPLPADALLTILDELERMKKNKQLLKP